MLLGSLAKNSTTSAHELFYSSEERLQKLLKYSFMSSYTRRPQIFPYIMVQLLDPPL